MATSDPGTSRGIHFNLNTFVTIVMSALTISVVIWKGGGLEEKIHAMEREQVKAAVRQEELFRKVNDLGNVVAEDRGEFRARIQVLEATRHVR